MTRGGEADNSDLQSAPRPGSMPGFRLGKGRSGRARQWHDDLLCCARDKPERTVYKLRPKERIRPYPFVKHKLTKESLRHAGTAVLAFGSTHPWRARKC